MELISNFLLLAASATACLYCFVLSRRLRALSNSNEGIGAGVAALAASAGELRTALTATQEAAMLTTSELRQVTRAADAKAAELRALMSDFAATNASLVQVSDETMRGYMNALRPIIDEAHAATRQLQQAADNARPPNAATVSAEPSFDRAYRIDPQAPFARQVRMRLNRSGEAA